MFPTFAVEVQPRRVHRTRIIRIITFHQYATTSENLHLIDRHRFGVLDTTVQNRVQYSKIPLLCGFIKFQD